MPVTVPERLIPRPKIKIDVDAVAQSMLDNAATDPTVDSFCVMLPAKISTRDPAAGAIWTEIADALGRAGLTFTVDSFADGRTRRYHPEVPAREA